MNKKRILVVGTARRKDGSTSLVELTTSGRVWRCDAVSCVWSGTERFDGWFRSQYPDVEIFVDGGAKHHLAQGKVA